MPTPNPSTLPAAIATVTGLFTANYATFVEAAIAVVLLIVIPVLVIRGGLRIAIRGLGRIFKAAS